VVPSGGGSSFLSGASLRLGLSPRCLRANPDFAKDSRYSTWKGTAWTTGSPCTVT
jgi:hypothetical protein